MSTRSATVKARECSNAMPSLGPAARQRGCVKRGVDITIVVYWGISCLG
ncbi:hypothetical protein MIDIC_270009 [Alphaproteobacteria bacterium]